MENIPTQQPSHDEERKLQYFVDNCRHVPIDNTRIKQLTRDKIRNDEMARRIGRLRWTAWISVAAAVVAIVWAGWGLLPHSGSVADLSEATMAQISDAGYEELVVPAGQRRQIALADGTELVANSRTRVLYPTDFSGSERRIYADGEVFLRVAKDPSHPFVVESEGFEVRVLGTVFNMANRGDSIASIVLVEGSVEVTTDTDQRVRMQPDDMLDLVDGNIKSLRKVDTSDYIGWIDGILNLRGVDLRAVCGMLGDHYGVAVECDHAIAGERIYGKLDLKDSIDDVLGSIGLIVPMTVNRNGSIIRLEVKGEPID